MWGACWEFHGRELGSYRGVYLRRHSDTVCRGFSRVKSAMSWNSHPPADCGSSKIEFWAEQGAKNNWFMRRRASTDGILGWFLLPICPSPARPAESESRHAAAHTDWDAYRKPIWWRTVWCTTKIPSHLSHLSQSALTEAPQDLKVQINKILLSGFRPHSTQHTFNMVLCPLVAGTKKGKWRDTRKICY